MERELFFDHFKRLSLSPQTRSALELEWHEFLLGNIDTGGYVTVRTGNKQQRFGCNKFEVVNLQHHPSHYDQVAGLPQSSAPKKPYLLSRFGRRVEYFEIDHDIAADLTRLKRAGKKGSSLNLSAENLREFLEVGILTDKPVPVPRLTV